jgi:hypothetical protein
MSRLSASEIIYAGARRKLLEIGRATRDEGQGVGTLSLVLRLDIRGQQSAVSSQQSGVSSQQSAISGQ